MNEHTPESSPGESRGAGAEPRPPSKSGRDMAGAGAGSQPSPASRHDVQDGGAEPQEARADAQHVEAAMPAPVVRSAGERGARAVYEHLWAVRFTHWLNAVSIFVLAASGLRIFTAFPSFGPKIPQHDFIDVPSALTLGGWLGGALQWHFTFMWIFGGAALLYVVSQLASGHWRTLLVRPRDLRGVWPMVRHYFLFGPKPRLTEQYNPLQKLAYSTTLLFGLLVLLTGIVLYKPVQFSWLGALFGGYRWARVWHFVAMCGLVAFVPGHLLMVVLHGWRNFVSILTGWKRDPEYLSD